MSDFKAKMYQIQFRLGLCPRPRWGSLQRSPRPGLRGLLLRGGDGNGRGTGGREREGKEERRGKGRRGVEGRRAHPFTPPNPYFWIRP